MKMEFSIKTDKELFEKTADELGEGSKVSILRLSAEEVEKHLDTSVHLRSSMFILVLNGTADIEINFRKYSVSQRHLILLSFGHFFNIHQVSMDFDIMVLYVSKDYIDEMFSTEMIYKRAKFGVKMHKLPLLQLQEDEREILQRRLKAVREVVLNEKHIYYKEMILNSLHSFFLDLSHIIEKEGQELEKSNPNRDELYFQSFLELLVLNYRSQHQVEFYSGKLHITTHYLTLIVKRLSGQTVSDLIFQLLYSEAKLLLQSDLSIQQIAAELHFSDQSAFGKFFKRKSGRSPREFRNQLSK